ncbi:hypothetical protein BDZ89DRAFT_1066720 [Hymenopellis radicata]|nr:hypothetical protein BDZ89DRAFT_1066720 [Hymenopellis radicata]
MLRDAANPPIDPLPDLDDIDVIHEDDDSVMGDATELSRTADPPASETSSSLGKRKRVDDDEVHYELDAPKEVDFRLAEFERDIRESECQKEMKQRQKCRRIRYRQDVTSWSRATDHVQAILRHQIDPKRNRGNRKKNWVPLYSPLRESTTIVVGDEYVSSYAFNHKVSLEDCQAHVRPQVEQNMIAVGTQSGPVKKTG